MLKTIKSSFLISLFLVTSLYASETAEPESAASKIFSGYFGESIWTLVWFTLLLVVLGKIAWKPILNSLQARENHIASQIKSAEDTRKAAEDTLAQYKHKLTGAEVEGKAIAGQHITQAQGKAQEILEKARLDAEQIRQRAKEDIDRAKNSAQKLLLKEAGEMVFELGSHILSRSVTPLDNEKLIEEAVGKYKQKKQMS